MSAKKKVEYFDDTDEYKDDGQMIYVRSLAHYNAGHLIGKWFDAREDNLLSRVSSWIYSLDHYGAQCEEWAIHDYENFGEFEIKEYGDLNTIESVAKAIAEHGCAVTAWLSYTGADEFNEDDFLDSYRGEWSSELEYAQSFFDEVYLYDIPESVQIYVDYEAFTRDLFISDCWSAKAQGGNLYIFWRS